MPEKSKQKAKQRDVKSPPSPQPSTSWMYKGLMVVNLAACVGVAGYFAWGGVTYAEVGLRRFTGGYQPPAGASEAVGTALRYSAEQGMKYLQQDNKPRPPPPCGGVEGMFVLDGVCDCCDGSDENLPNNITWCPNTCAAQRNHTLVDLRRRIADIDAALGVKEEVMMENTLDWPSLSSRIVGTKDHMENEVQRIQSEAQQPGADMQLLERQYRQVMMQAEQMQSLFRITKNDFGPYLSYFPLFGQCHEYTANERYFKGGCAEPDAKDFTFTLCLFDKAYQQALKEDPEDEADAPVILGTYHGWAEEPMPATYDNPSPRVVQVYEGGAPCYDGPPRRVLVSFQCSQSTNVSAVYENGKCTYEMVLNTPLACTYKDLYQLQEELKGY